MTTFLFFFWGGFGDVTAAAVTYGPGHIAELFVVHPGLREAAVVHPGLREASVVHPGLKEVEVRW